MYTVPKLKIYGGHAIPPKAVLIT